MSGSMDEFLVSSFHWCDPAGRHQYFIGLDRPAGDVTITGIVIDGIGLKIYRDSSNAPRQTDENFIGKH